MRILGLERTSKLSLGAWRQLVKLLRHERVDVLHGHMFGSNVWASVLGTLPRSAVVAHEHMWSYDGGRARALIDRHVIARVRTPSSRSRAGRAAHGRIRGPRPADIVIIPNGIARSRRRRSEAREALGLAADDRVVGTVGHLRPEKAFEMLVEAAARLRQREPGLRVLIAGEGEGRACWRA